MLRNGGGSAHVLPFLWQAFLVAGFLMAALASQASRYRSSALSSSLSPRSFAPPFRFTFQRSKSARSW